MLSSLFAKMGRVVGRNAPPAKKRQRRGDGTLQQLELAFEEYIRQNYIQRGVGEEGEDVSVLEVLMDFVTRPTFKSLPAAPIPENSLEDVYGLLRDALSKLHVRSGLGLYDTRRNTIFRMRRLGAGEAQDDGEDEEKEEEEKDEEMPPPSSKTQIPSSDLAALFQIHTVYKSFQLERGKSVVLRLRLAEYTNGFWEYMTSDSLPAGWKRHRNGQQAPRIDRVVRERPRVVLAAVAAAAAPEVEPEPKHEWLIEYDSKNRHLNGWLDREVAMQRISVQDAWFPDQQVEYGIQLVWPFKSGERQHFYINRVGAASEEWGGDQDRDDGDGDAAEEEGEVQLWLKQHRQAQMSDEARANAVAVQRFLTQDLTWSRASLGTFYRDILKISASGADVWWHRKGAGMLWTDFSTVLFSLTLTLNDDGSDVSEEPMVRKHALGAVNSPRRAEFARVLASSSSHLTWLPWMVTQIFDVAPVSMSEALRGQTEFYHDIVTQEAIQNLPASFPASAAAFQTVVRGVIASESITASLWFLKHLRNAWDGSGDQTKLRVTKTNKYKVWPLPKTVEFAVRTLEDEKHLGRRLFYEGKTALRPGFIFGAYTGEIISNEEAELRTGISAENSSYMFTASRPDIPGIGRVGITVKNAVKLGASPELVAISTHFINEEGEHRIIPPASWTVDGIDPAASSVGRYVNTCLNWPECMAKQNMRFVQANFGIYMMSVAAIKTGDEIVADYGQDRVQLCAGSAAQEEVDGMIFPQHEFNRVTTTVPALWRQISSGSEK